MVGNYQRKYFLDNIRTICILILFPYHTLMIYNTWGENFYIQGSPSNVTLGFVGAVWPWIMPLMFVIAGMAANYSLQKRTAKEFVKERTISLFIPLVAGILILCPMMVYFAIKSNNAYTGGYFESYVPFFTTNDNFSGARGGFTPGHLWFILFLFVITLAMLPIVLLLKKSKKRIPFEKFPLVLIIFLFILTFLSSFLPDIGGKNPFEYFVLFLLGYYVLSNDKILDKLEKYKWFLSGGFIIMIVLCMLYLFVLDMGEGFGDLVVKSLVVRLCGWIGILAILGTGKRYLNQNNKFTRYCSKASFPVYILHQSILVMVAYYVFMFANTIALQAVLVIFISFIATVACYEIIRRIPCFRVLFGIRVKKKVMLQEEKINANEDAIVKPDNVE